MLAVDFHEPDEIRRQGEAVRVAHQHRPPITPAARHGRLLGQIRPRPRDVGGAAVGDAVAQRVGGAHQPRGSQRLHRIAALGRLIPAAELEHLADGRRHEGLARHRRFGVGVIDAGNRHFSEHPEGGIGEIGVVGHGRERKRAGQASFDTRPPEWLMVSAGTDHRLL